MRTVRQSSAATLLVLDNVDVWSSERQPGPLPEGTHLRYLVTTRQRRLGGARFEHVGVGFLEPEFARQLVESVSGRELVATPGLDDLLEYLGGHALAAELVGAFLGVYPEETPASYLAPSSVARPKPRSAIWCATTVPLLKRSYYRVNVERIATEIRQRPLAGADIASETG